MAVNGVEPTAAMGNDTPLAVLSNRPQTFFNYFRQQFAQVTNPAIDSIRESLVMSLTEYIGRVGAGILTPDESNCKMVRLPHPILNNTQLDILCNIRYKGFNTVKLPMLFECKKGEDGLRDALSKLCHDAEQSVDAGYNYIILSDREVDQDHAAIPSLLAVSAVHHYLISVGKRVQTALIVESGEIRETMHAALLLGFGISNVPGIQAKLDAEEEQRRQKEQERQEEYEERRDQFYGGSDKKGIQRRRPKFYLFGLDDLDNEEVISMVELTPTYKRSKEVLADIKAKALGTVAIEPESAAAGAVINFG